MGQERPLVGETRLDSLDEADPAGLLLIALLRGRRMDGTEAKNHCQNEMANLHATSPASQEWARAT